MTASPKPQVLLTVPMMPHVSAALEEAYAVHKLWLAPDRTAFIASVAPGIRAVVTNGGAGANAALIDALPQLGVIVSNGVGVDAIDLAAAKARGIGVTTTPDVLTDDVADLAIALLLAVCRRVVEGDAHVRSRAWARQGELTLGTRVSGKRAGIVGLGRIGRAVAQRLQGFDVTVAYHDAAPRAVPYRHYPSLEQMAAEVDFLIVTAAAGPATRKLVNAPVLAALGSAGVVINVSRGSVVDEDALLDALERKTIAAAGLDVFWNEPNIAERFLTLPNAVLTPHHASGTVETRRAMGDLVLANLAAYFAGEPLPTPFPLPKERRS